MEEQRERELGETERLEEAKSRRRERKKSPIIAETKRFKGMEEGKAAIWQDR